MQLLLLSFLNFSFACCSYVVLRCTVQKFYFVSMKRLNCFVKSTLFILKINKLSVLRTAVRPPQYARPLQVSTWTTTQSGLRGDLDCLAFNWCAMSAVARQFWCTSATFRYWIMCKHASDWLYMTLTSPLTTYVCRWCGSSYPIPVLSLKFVSIPFRRYNTFSVSALIRPGEGEQTDDSHQRFMSPPGGAGA